MYNFAAVSFKKSSGFGSSNNDCIEHIVSLNFHKAGAHSWDNLSTETSQFSEILGWKISVIKTNLGGLKGKSLENNILNKKYPFSKDVSGGPSILLLRNYFLN